MECLVLDGVDVADELRSGRPGFWLRCAARRVHQRDAGTLNTGYRLHGEVGDVAQQVDDAAAARDDSGKAVQPGE